MKWGVAQARVDFDTREVTYLRAAPQCCTSFPASLPALRPAIDLSSNLSSNSNLVVGVTHFALNPEVKCACARFLIVYNKVVGFYKI